VDCSIGEVRGEELAGHTLSMFSRGVRRWDGGHTEDRLRAREVNETTRMRSITGRLICGYALAWFLAAPDQRVSDTVSHRPNREPVGSGAGSIVAHVSRTRTVALVPNLPQSSLHTTHQTSLYVFTTAVPSPLILLI
jgi:hypothetical protein